MKLEFFYKKGEYNYGKKIEDGTITAILVDGGFYRRRAYSCLGDKTPEERANELEEYCIRHLNERKGYRHKLYRIFYYDCPPISKNVYHPLLKKQVDLGKTDTFKWSEEFLNC